MLECTLALILDKALEIGDYGLSIGMSEFTGFEDVFFLDERRVAINDYFKYFSDSLAFFLGGMFFARGEEHFDAKFDSREWGIKVFLESRGAVFE